MCFFFQAEDGIRDLVRSRGLGDVYKRQNILSTEESSKTTSETIKGSGVVTVGAKHAATDVYLSLIHI